MDVQATTAMVLALATVGLAVAPAAAGLSVGTSAGVTGPTVNQTVTANATVTEDPSATVALDLDGDAADEDESVSAP